MSQTKTWWGNKSVRNSVSITECLLVCACGSCLSNSDFKWFFPLNLCHPRSASNITTDHINTAWNRHARDRLVVLKWCSLLGNSGSRTGIWLNWAEHMSPVFMLKSISTNTTDPGQHPRAKSLLLVSFKQLPSVKSVQCSNSVHTENKCRRNIKLVVNYITLKM